MASREFIPQILACITAAPRSRRSYFGSNTLGRGSGVRGLGDRATNDQKIRARPDGVRRRHDPFLVIRAGPIRPYTRHDQIHFGAKAAAKSGNFVR